MNDVATRPHNLRAERMQASRLWSGNRFRNVHPLLPGLRDETVKRPSLGDFLWGGERRVPSRPLPLVDPRGYWRSRPGSGLRATWLGHSTVLLEMDGLRILTDPVWGKRASPSRLIGPKRFQPVPVALDSLPPIDLVLISHDHYDHLDYLTIRALARTNVPFVTSLGVGVYLEAWGVPASRVVELDWWEQYALPGAELIVTAAPSQHFSGRGLRDQNTTLWSLRIAIRSACHCAFFSGDTGLTTEYLEIGQRLGPFDLVMLEVGAFHPSWGHIHLGPANAIEALNLLGGGAFLPVHWGTFSLGLHPWDQPAEDLLLMAPQHDVTLLMPRIGEPVEPATGIATLPWWRTVDSDSAASRRADQAQAPDEASLAAPLD